MSYDQEKNEYDGMGEWVNGEWTPDPDTAWLIAVVVSIVLTAVAIVVILIN